MLYGTGECATFNKNSTVVDKNISKKVRLVTLDSVLKDHKMDVIHFIKIDCEGWEKRSLLGLNFRLHRPWIFCIESTLPCTHISCYDEWEYILFDANYEYVGEIGANRYYVAKEVKNKLQPFLSEKELNEIYYVTRFNPIDYDSISYREKISQIKL